MKFLPYGQQTIDESDIEALVRVAKSDYLTTGPEIEAFERALSEHVEAEYCIAVSSATAALHLAVLALDLPRESEGIVPTNTFLATANAMAYTEGIPVFADIDPHTYCISEQELSAKLTSRTKVALPVHFAGRPPEMDRIAALCEANNVTVIEDAAHALGSRYTNGRPVGCCCFSAMTIFSFHPVKTITSGEGGVITTNDRYLYEELKALRSHGMRTSATTLVQTDLAYDAVSGSPNAWYYEMHKPGFNYRMSALHAALGRSQLSKLSLFSERRREIVERYNEAFFGLPNIQSPTVNDTSEISWHLYVVRINFEKCGLSRHQFMQELMNAGIGTQVHYIPVHLQPYYRTCLGYAEGDLPVAESYYSEALSLPLYPSLTESDVDRVIEKVSELVS